MLFFERFLDLFGPFSSLDFRDFRFKNCFELRHQTIDLHLLNRISRVLHSLLMFEKNFLLLERANFGALRHDDPSAGALLIRLDFVSLVFFAREETIHLRLEILEASGAEFLRLERFVFAAIGFKTRAFCFFVFGVLNRKAFVARALFERVPRRLLVAQQVSARCLLLLHLEESEFLSNLSVLRCRNFSVFVEKKDFFEFGGFGVENSSSAISGFIVDDVLKKEF